MMPLAPRETLTQISSHATQFYNRGWLLGTSGNFSSRHDVDSYWVTTSGLDKGDLSAEDFIHLSPHLSPVDPSETRKPSDESLVHEAIYKHIKTAQVVYHVHPPYGTWLSRQEPPKIHLLKLPAIEMVKGLGFPTHEVDATLLILPNTQSMQDLCLTLEPLWQTLTVPAFFIQGHGLYAWGSSPQVAKRHVEVLEFLFQQLVWDKWHEGCLPHVI